MKILILATKSLSSNLLINSLSKDYFLEVLFENKVSKRVFWVNRLKRLGFIAVTGQILFLLLTYLLKVFNKQELDCLSGEDHNSISPSKNISIKYIDSVNSDESIERIRDTNPDLVILNGTRIVSKKVLSSIGCLFINTHCGITPKYRGVHGGYWAIYNNDLDNYGVTVHKVDSGIDTGDILYQDKVDYDPKDNYFTYPIKQYLAALPLIKKVIKQIEVGENINAFKREDLESKLWFHPTIFQYLYGLFFKRVK